MKPVNIIGRLPLKSDESWTLDKARVECVRRGWWFEATTWTERFPLPGGGYRTVTRDLLGFVDALAATGSGTVAIQVTSRSHVADRASKALASPRLEFVRQAGWRLVVWGFERSSGECWERVLVEGILCG